MTLKIVAITGTPGVGKSTIARKLSLLLNYTYLSGSLLVKTAKLAKKYDKTRKTAIVDPSLFTHAVLKVSHIEAKKGSLGLIVDSHLSHFMPSKAISACVVLTCSLPTLATRLAKKGFNKAKIRENLDAEIFDTILVEATENFKTIKDRGKIIKFNTTKATKKEIKALSLRIKRLVRS